jgi:hypothetical protein
MKNPQDWISREENVRKSLKIFFWLLREMPFTV